MKTKLIKGKKDILLVEVPEDAEDIIVRKAYTYMPVGSMEYSEVLFSSEIQDPFKIGGDIIPLPVEGYWKITSTIEKLTEEQASKILNVEVDEDIPDVNRKMFLQLLWNNGVELENPLGNFNSFDKLVYNHTKDRLKEWQEVEEKVFNPKTTLILTKDDETV